MPALAPPVREALDDGDSAVQSADVAMLPTSTVEVTDAGQVKQLMRLMDLLDDVQDVHGSMDVPDEIMDAIAAE